MSKKQVLFQENPVELQYDAAITGKLAPSQESQLPTTNKVSFPLLLIFSHDSACVTLKLPSFFQNWTKWRTHCLNVMMVGIYI